MKSSGTPCVAPTSRGRSCEDRPLPGAPFPICVHHLAMLIKFANDEHQRQREPIPEIDLTGAQRAAAQQGIIYYVQIGDLIKIGTTVDLAVRMRAYPPDAVLLATEPGGFQVETARLRQFEHLRQHRREWHSQGPDLMEHIERLQRDLPQHEIHADGLAHVARLLGR